LEEEVGAAWRGEGYDGRPQVGRAGFCIDLAVTDAKYPGRYVLGIECDGAAYHSSRSARDRDRLRQAVLEDHGWTIHRIWSTDWFQRPQEQLRRTVATIEAAKAELEARGAEKAEATNRAVPIKIVNVDRGNAAEVSLERSVPRLSAPYQEAAFGVPSSTQQIHEVPTGAMAEIVRQIVSVEGPVHADEIVERVRSLWGLQRAGNRIQTAVACGIAAAVRSGTVIKEGNFYSLPGGIVQVRDRGATTSPSLRRPEVLPPAELRLAALSIIHQNYGAGREEVATIVSRLLGFKATSAQLRATIEQTIEDLLASGALIIGDDGTLILPSG
jgi:very-short-patch-repair endonuclease